MRRVGSAEYSFVRTLMIINVWWIGCFAYKSPLKAARVMKELLVRHRKLLGKTKHVRAVRNQGRYYWDIFNPGWPSRSFNSFFKNQLHEVVPISGATTSLRRMLIAITKKCPLNCEHCSEGATLNNADILSYDEMKSRIQEFVDRGVGQLVYSGGEPLNRFNDLLLLLNDFRKDCDQWIYTSGYGLTLEKARQLKAAGLNGAAISLDHHDEEKHNLFRRNGKSYKWVMEAIANCKVAGILPSLNVCPTREYVNSNGLEEYMDFARTLEIPVVTILEPRSVGNYADRSVEFTLNERQKVMELNNRYNFTKSLFEYPTIVYPGGFRNQWPCGGGRSYLFLDYDGKLYPCPFCKVNVRDVSLTTVACQAS
ncbi:MAG: radical SAM protein [Bacteroidota bacterium]